MVALSVPAGLTAPLLVRSSLSSLFITWSAASDSGGDTAALNYSLEIKEVTAGTTASFSEIYRGENTQYEAKHLRSGGVFLCRVRAFNSKGPSADYSSESVPMVTAEKPSPPLQLSLVQRSNLPSIEIKWSTSLSDGGIELTGYRVYRKDSASGVFEQVVSAPSTTNPHITSYADLSVTAGDFYEYRVTALNS